MVKHIEHVLVPHNMVGHDVHASYTGRIMEISHPYQNGDTGNTSDDSILLKEEYAELEKYAFASPGVFGESDGKIPTLKVGFLSSALKKS